MACLSNDFGTPFRFYMDSEPCGRIDKCPEQVYRCRCWRGLAMPMNRPMLPWRTIRADLIARWTVLDRSTSRRGLSEGLPNTSRYAGRPFFETILYRLYHNLSARTPIANPPGYRGSGRYYPPANTFYYRLQRIWPADERYPEHNPLLALWRCYIRGLPRRELTAWDQAMRYCRFHPMVTRRPGKLRKPRSTKPNPNGMIVVTSWFPWFEDALRLEVARRRKRL